MFPRTDLCQVCTLGGTVIVPIDDLLLSLWTHVFLLLLKYASIEQVVGITKVVIISYN